VNWQVEWVDEEFGGWMLGSWLQGSKGAVIWLVAIWQRCEGVVW